MLKASPAFVVSASPSRGPTWPTRNPLLTKILQTLITEALITIESADVGLDLIIVREGAKPEFIEAKSRLARAKEALADLDKLTGVAPMAEGDPHVALVGNRGAEPAALPAPEPELLSTQADRRLYRCLKTGLVSEPEPLQS
jgi:hypothetical protein